MKIVANKSSYKKLYLIPSDMYNRIVPNLSEIEKQELNELQESNLPSGGNNEVSEEEKIDDAEEVIDSPPENEEVNIHNHTTPAQEMEVNKPKTSMNLVSKSNGGLITKKKKVKNFSCQVCVNKKFTTKRSLERHNNNFHVKKHSIKDDEVIPEVIHPDNTLTETATDNDRRTKNLKRKFKYDPDEFHYIRDNQTFSKDEPLIKRSRGVNINVPKREKIKRKLSPNPDEFEEKRFDWEEY